MRKKNNLFDYINVVKLIITLFAFVLLNKLQITVHPYSTALYVALVALNYSFITTSILYLLSFIIVGAPGLLVSGTICAFTILIIKLIRLKFKSKNNFEYFFFTIASLIGYLAIGNTNTQPETFERILCVIISSTLTLIFIISLNAIDRKGLRYKMNQEEYVCITVSVAVLGLCICNLISPILWKGISVFLILTAIFVLNSGSAITISAGIGVSLSIYYGNPTFIAVYVVWALSSFIFSSLSRHVGALALVFCDYVCQLLFAVYQVYHFEQIIPIVSGALLFCVIPTKSLLNLKEKIHFFNEKQLARQSINRNRLTLSNRLYELSGVFTEMSSAFNAFKNICYSDEKIKEVLCKNLQTSVCELCEHNLKCKYKDKKRSIGLNKMLNIGIAKNRISLIDLPPELSEICIHPTDLIYGLNKYLAEYKAKKITNLNLSTSRELISKEAEGIAEILKGLALESGALLKYHTKLERALSDALLKKGFLVSEILVYGEEKVVNVSLILTMKEFSLNALQDTISKVLKCNFILFEKNNVTEEKVYLSFKKRTEYDAVFGVAKATKDNSEISGDTHSVLRISDDKFLVALSDGMGSGKDAQSISSISLSLIESFYKAGMNSNLILNTVNKLLSVNTEDSFTALDVSIINLKDKTVDFIKYGAPYGFIINDGSIKIIEGNTLPLGILEELSPSIAQAKVNDGDMILLITDGIADSFGSSSSIIDFLRSVPAKNPQTLSNQVLSKAISLNQGRRLDDMTTLAVRVFKN